MIPKANNYKLLDSGKEKMASLTGGRRVLLTIFVSIFLLLVMPLVSAEIQTLGTFKQNSVVNLLQLCGNCTYNNITSVAYPNSTQAIGQIGMTRTGTIFNASYSRTSVIGNYNVNGFGDLDGVQTPWSYNFYVTADGVDQALSGRSNGMLWVAFAMAGLFMLIASQIEGNRFILKGGLYFFALASLLIAGNFALDFATSTKSEKMFFSLFIILVIGAGSFITYMLVMYFKGLMKAFKQVRQEKADSDEI